MNMPFGRGPAISGLGDAQITIVAKYLLSGMILSSNHRPENDMGVCQFSNPDHPGSGEHMFHYILA